MYNAKFCLVLFFLIVFSQKFFSQNSIVQKTDTTGYYRLNDVVVTATKTATNLLAIANSISVIDSEKIANSNAANVFDILKSEIGVSYTQQGGNGTLSNINIRGASNSHTLVLIDGIEMNLTNDVSGVYDFSSLPADNIDRIEILRGPQSTLYGSDAIAGVINIITKKGSGTSKFSLLTEGGSYQTYKAQLGLNGAIQKLNYSISASRSQSEGFSVANEDSGNTEKDGYTFNNFSGLVGYNFSDFAEINLFTRFLKSESDNDQFGGRYGDDPTYITNQEEFSIRTEGKLKLFNGFWNQKIGFSFIRNVRKNSSDTSAASIYYSHASYDGKKYKLDWQNDFTFSSNNLLTFGAELEFDKSTSESFYLNYLGLDDYITISPLKDTRTFGVYLQDQINFENTFFITAGLRADNHNLFGTNFTYRISPAFMLWETGTKIKTSIGTGFKSPTLYGLFDPIYGNKKLQPEKSFGWDFGVEQFLFSNQLIIGATFFYNKFDDMIAVDYSQFKSININKAITKGFEFYTSINPINWFNCKINYTYTDARDISPNSANFGTNLLRRPKHKVALFTNLNITQKANFNTELIWLTNRDDLDFSQYPAQRKELHGYALLNVAAHYELFNFLRLNIRAENLLDTDYEEVLGYGTAGLSVYGGIKLTF